MQNLYTFDELQSKAHKLSIEFAKSGEPLKAAIMQQASASLAHEENQGDSFSLTKAVLAWKKAIEYAKESLINDLEDTNPELFTDETFNP